jgi:hypothetical protein
MTHGFLNAGTIEAAHSEYLNKHWNKPPVQKKWGKRKPSLKQFVSRFGKSWEARQRQLKLEDKATMTTALVVQDKRVDHIQRISEVIDQLQEKAAFLALADDQVAPEPPKTPPVKVEEDGLPTHGQVVFLMNRARDLHEDRCVVPVTRGKASELIAKIQGGTSYHAACVELFRK